MEGGGLSAAPSLMPSDPPGYGDAVSVGQFGAVVPFESVQLILPFGAASTNGLTGEFAAT